MVNKIWNINILLCGQCDDNVANINNIFDKLNVDDNNQADFDIVTIMNAIGSDEEKFRLYYFVEKINDGKNMIAYIGSSLHKRSKGNLKSRDKKDFLAGSVEGTTFKTTVMRLRSCDFPGLGNYEIKVYKYDNDSVVELENDDIDVAKELAKDDHLVATYPFIVGRNKS